MALPVNGSTHLIPAYYSFYRPRKNERLSWPCWLTYSRWPTHNSGHPSAAGRPQDRESSPARDRRSTTVPRHQLIQVWRMAMRACVVDLDLRQPNWQLSRCGLMKVRNHFPTIDSNTLSVTSRSSIETDKRIGLVFVMGASFDLSYTVL